MHIHDNIIPAEWLDSLNSATSKPSVTTAESSSDNKHPLSKDSTDSHSSLSGEPDNEAGDLSPDIDLIDLLQADIPRTFPDVPYYQNSAVRCALFKILFIYAKQNPDIGYRQGMHELAAPMIQVVWEDLNKLDSREGGASGEQYFKSDDSTSEKTVVVSDDAESDAYFLFCALMKQAKQWYLPTSSDSGVHIPPPIVAKSHYIQYKLLQNSDPVLSNQVAQALTLARAEPQLWALRWIRLLFAREVGVKNFLWLWDAIFAATDPNSTYNAKEDYSSDNVADPDNVEREKEDVHIETDDVVLNTFAKKRCLPLELLVDYICIVLLLRIKSILLFPVADPSPSSSTSSVNAMSQSLPLDPTDHAAHIIGSLLNYPTTTTTIDIRAMPLIVANAARLIEHDGGPDCAGYVARQYSRDPGVLIASDESPNSLASRTGGLQQGSSQIMPSVLTAGLNTWMGKARTSVTRSVNQARNPSSWDDVMQSAKTALLNVREQVREQAEQMSEQVREQIRERERDRERERLTAAEASRDKFRRENFPQGSRRSSTRDTQVAPEEEQLLAVNILGHALRVLEEPRYVNVHKSGSGENTPELSEKEETDENSELNYKTALAYVRFARDLLAHSSTFNRKDVQSYLNPIGVEPPTTAATDETDTNPVIEEPATKAVTQRTNSEETIKTAAEETDDKPPVPLVPVDASPAPILIRSRRGKRPIQASIQDKDTKSTGKVSNSLFSRTTSSGSGSDSTSSLPLGKTLSGTSKVVRTTIAQSEFSWILGKSSSGSDDSSAPKARTPSPKNPFAKSSMDVAKDEKQTSEEKLNDNEVISKSVTKEGTAVIIGGPENKDIKS